MSQFHFPRLHFSGKASIDPATGNNNYHYPLVNFDPIYGMAILPPRIYLDSAQEIKAIKIHLADYKQYLKKDQEENSYIELSPIDTPKSYKTWMTAPLGTLEIDKAFHQLYKNTLTKNESLPLSGLCPAYWNYYGTMNFNLKEVLITQVQISHAQANIKKTINTNAFNWIGSELLFEFTNGKNSAVMIDVSPTLSLFSQVFCSRISLSKDGKTTMDGNPLKGSLRQMNVNRVENDLAITGSSGTFYHSLPFSNLNIENSKEILDFFYQHIPNSQRVKGISIRYDLSEVQEDINPDYKQLGMQPNPAHVHISGTITPWLEGEFVSHPPGRRLDYLNEYQNKSYLGSCFSYYQKGLNILSIDLIGSLPQIYSNGQYELAELGELSFDLIHNNQKHKIGTINITENQETVYHLKSRGGIYDFIIDNPIIESLLQSNKGRLEISSDNKVLLKEKELRIISDQTGIYADQFDSIDDGFFSNSAQRELCQLIILLRGKPYLNPIEVMLIELSLLPNGRGDSMRIKENINTIRHNQIIKWPTEKAGHFFYVFVPVEYDTIPLDIKHHMIKTGEFINLRVLPSFDESTVSNDEVKFEDVYKHILETFDLIYPSSSIITPFNEAHLSKRAKFLLKIMDEAYWGEYLYMPSSRDLSKGKRKLIFNWIQQLNSSS